MSGDFGKENKSGQVEQKLKLSGDRMHGMKTKTVGNLERNKSWHRTETPHTCPRMHVNVFKTRTTSLVVWMRK
jgi:hypothetical protein